MMTKFSFARQPYYVAVAIFALFAALVAYVNNTTNSASISMESGLLSDIYLVLMVACIGVAGIACSYLYHALQGEDVDAVDEVAGLPFGKKYFYYAVLALCAWRAIAGYESNHWGSGWESTWGMVWFISAPLLAVYTWINYRSYLAKIGGKIKPMARV